MAKSRGDNRESGFTLVEVLIVMVVIGVLSAIAIPVYNNQTRSANDRALVSDVRNAAMVVETAMGEFDGYAGVKKAAGVDKELTIFVNDDPIVGGVGSAPVYWSDSGKLPAITRSQGTYMEIVNIHPGFNGASSHWQPHEDYDFCIVASHGKGKKYNRIPGDGSLTYDQYLYYDKRLGGITEPSEVIEAVRGKSDKDAAEVSSCHAYGLRYLEATGQ